MSLLDTFKDIHVKIKKDAHSNLRALLFKKELSMQELFEEISQLILSEDRYMMNMIDRLVVKKAQAKLDKVTKRSSFSELDNETLYSLIEDASPLDKTDEEER